MVNRKKKYNTQWKTRVISVRRVTKVVKGGKKLSFRAVVAIGDQQGKVGVGVGKANDANNAIKKAVTSGHKNIISVPLTSSKSIPHKIDGRFGAAKLILRPAAPGCGVIAGGAPRIILESVGIKNILSKQLGSNNLLNNARATIESLKSFRKKN